jgi:glycosyltransferase 2 family protein
LKERIVTILRWTIPLAIVGYLVFDVRRQAGFDQIWYGGKNWSFLGLALLFFLAAQLLTIARWYWLVRALDLPFRWNDAVRLGFLGYLLTFVSLGTVGGDLLKALFVAREQPRRRLEAFSTVVVDRVFGLYSLILLAAGAIIASGIWQSPTTPAVGILCQAVFGVTAASTVGLLIFLSLRGSPTQQIVEWLGRLPMLGKHIKPIAGAVLVYRRKLITVVASIIVGLISQALVAASLWAVARALSAGGPGAGAHLIIVPLALLTTLLPLPGYGLGVFELALEFLYRHVGLAGAGTGLLVAVGFRIVMVATAAIGAVMCAATRREVGSVLREAEEEYEQLAAGA